MDQIRAAVSSNEVPDGVTRSQPEIPEYLQRTYRWAYLDARNAKILDHEFIVRSILWHQHRRLEQAAFSEIEPGQRVLQAACVYGRFSKLLAEHVTPAGDLEIVDVAEVQVTNCRKKLAAYDHVTVRQQDIVDLHGESFDSVCCYFLLHEMPYDYKQRVASTLLRSVRPGGKVVFVDYHKPHWAHPLRPVTSLVFKTLEPYAKELWSTDISDLIKDNGDFEWRKETYFGHLFQKVVATRRSQG